MQKRGRWTENTELLLERDIRELQSHLGRKASPEKQAFCRTSIKHNDKCVYGK